MNFVGNGVFYDTLFEMTLKPFGPTIHKRYIVSYHCYNIFLFYHLLYYIKVIDLTILFFQKRWNEQGPKLKNQLNTSFECFKIVISYSVIVVYLYITHFGLIIP